jgi:hypothetical protein
MNKMTIKEVYQEVLKRGEYARKMKKQCETKSGAWKINNAEWNHWEGVEMANYDVAAMLEKTEEVNPIKK